MPTTPPTTIPPTTIPPTTTPPTTPPPGGGNFRSPIYFMPVENSPQDISTAMHPLPPDLEAGFWYFFYFLTDRGRAGLTANRRAIAEVIWRRNSPKWNFAVADLDRAAEAFDNPDYVDVVIHSYRHRLGYAAGAPAYAEAEAALALAPPITVPTVTLDGTADGNFPATDGSAGAVHFTGPRLHRRVADAGHNLPQEAPAAFADAVREASELAARGPSARSSRAAGRARSRTPARPSAASSARPTAATS